MLGLKQQQSHFDCKMLECEEMPDFGVEGMKSVVATVTGYNGLERFNLIRFITQVGANYVGAMTKSTTHLVCKKFQGKKYDLAKKNGTKIVNHLWFDDCVKAGNLIPESPYATQSGEEVGPFLAKIPPSAATNSKKYLIKQKRKVLFCESNCGNSDAIPASDFKYIDEGCSTWSDSYLLKDVNELVAMRKKRSYTSTSSHATKPGQKGRKLVKKSLSKISSRSSLSSDGIAHLEPKNISRTHHFQELPDGRTKGVRNNNGVSDELNNFTSNADEIVNDASEEVEEAYQMNTYPNSTVSSKSKKSCRQNFSLQNSPIDVGHSDGSTVATEDVCKRVQQSNLVEMSCVICWTDFSSTRGILPCGHRFCYACIQTWADQMASKGKPSTCPLCKAIFLIIRKVEDAEFCDQKIFSQTVPCSSTSENIVMLQGAESSYGQFHQSSTSLCHKCHNREPEDLLVSCHLCRSRMVHSFCLDPPSFPWTCIDCKELRTLVHHFR